MLSIIIPFHNEKENLPLLLTQLRNELDTLRVDYEIILIDDGSTDGYVLSQGSKIELITHKKRLGKGRSLSDGFEKAKGETILFMDADLQDDPADIKHFLKKLEEGYDFVNGWRKDRHDPASKRLPSSIFNFLLLRGLLHSHFHDINCGFKIMKSTVLEEFTFYGDNYRFLPIMVDRMGFHTTEIAVSHNERKFGKSKYGFFRLFVGLFDTISTYFIARFAERPLHFFGTIGSLSFFAGMVILTVLVYERLVQGILLYRRPAFIFAVLFIIVGIQIVMTGIIADLVVYLNHKKKKI